jgi:hypothetical protein
LAFSKLKNIFRSPVRRINYLMLRMFIISYKRRLRLKGSRSDQERNFFLVVSHERGRWPRASSLIKKRNFNLAPPS